MTSVSPFSTKDTIAASAPECIYQACRNIEHAAEYVDQIRQAYFLLPKEMDNALGDAHGILLEAFDILDNIETNGSAPTSP